MLEKTYTYAFFLSLNFCSMVLNEITLKLIIFAL